MHCPGRLRRCIPWSSRREQGVTIGQILGLDKQLAERRMCRVRRRRRQHDLAIAGDFDGNRRLAVIGQRNLADFDVLFRRERNFKVGFQITVAATKLGFIDGISHLVVVGRSTGRLMTGRPDSAGRNIAQIDELPAIVARRIRSPPRDGRVFKSAVTPPEFVTMTEYLPLDSK